MTIGRRIQRERQSRGWTQSRLAALVPIGQQTVSRWERDLTAPTALQIGRLIELFELDPDEPFAEPSAPSAPPGPSGRPLLAELPLSEMHWADFERFCAMLLKLLNPSASVHRFGGQGDRQDGIDVYVEDSNGAITTYQCKKYRPSTGFGPVKARAAIVASSHRATGHVLMLSCPATAPTRKEVMDTPGWDIWDSEDIADIIREKLDSDAQIQLVDRFFPGHRKDFLGVDELGPWLTAQKFFLSSNDPMTLVNHTRPLVGREETMSGLTAFCSGQGDCRVAIVSGTGGSGKTRLLKAVADVFPQDDSPIRLRFLSPHASAQPGQVEQLPGGPAVLIVDDAHTTPGLEVVFAAVAIQRPRLRIIATTRPGDIARIRALAQRAGLADQPLEFPLAELTLAESTALAEHVLAQGYAEKDAIHVACDVAALTRDWPLGTVLTAELMKRRRIPVQSVSGQSGFRQRVAAAFEDVLTAGLGDRRDADKIDALLQFFALLQPLAPDHCSFDELLLTVLGMSRDELRRPMGALQAAGVLLLRDGQMWLVPDALADLIAERACLDPVTGRPTGYADRLFGLELQGVGLPLRNLLVNVGKLDWHLSGGADGHATGLLDYMWQQINDRFVRTADPAQRAVLLQAVAEVAYYQPHRALHTASAAVQDLEAIGVRSGGFSADLLTRDLLALLRNAAYTYEAASIACDLLWKLAKICPVDDGTLPTPVKTLREIAAYSPGQHVHYSQRILETALGWLDDPWAADLSPFDMLDVFLATEASHTEYASRQVTIRWFTVEPEVVRPLRDRVVDAAVATVRTGTTLQAMRALSTLESAMSRPAGPADRLAEIRRCWEADQLRVLYLLRDLASSPLDPLLYTEILRIVRWHAAHGDPAVQDAALAALAAVPDTFEVRLIRCFVEGGEPSWLRNEADRQRASSEGSRLTEQTAREFTHEHPDAAAAVTKLRDFMSTVTSMPTGRQPAPSHFISALIALRFDIGEAIIEHVAANSSDPLTIILPAVLESLSAMRPDTAVACARKLAAAEDLSLDLQIARTYGPSAPISRTPTADELALIEQFAKHPDPRVRSMITLAVPRIMNSDRSRALRLLLSVDLAGNSGVAANVLFQLSSGLLSVGDLPAADRIALLNGLENCSDISQHPIKVFLREMARLHPDELIAMLMARIDHGPDRGWNFNQTLPFAWEQPADSPVALHQHPRLRQLLDILLDWINRAAGSTSVVGSSLIAAVSGPYDDAVITILGSWLETHLDRRGTETIASCLRVAPSSVLLHHHLFVTSLLETADSFGQECLATVRKALFQAAIAMPPSYRDQTLAAQTELRDTARRIAAELPHHSPARAFYRGLADHAEEMTRWASAI